MNAIKIKQVMIKKTILMAIAALFAVNVWGQTTSLTSLGSYLWNATDEPKTFTNKLQMSFVRSLDGFSQYGTVLAGGGYNNTGQDGGVFQIYFPYGEALGGIAPKIRLGRYDNEGWSSWETFYTSANANLSTVDWAAKGLIVYSDIGIGTTTPKSKLDFGTNYSDPSIYPNKITLWGGGENNYFGFGISSGDLDYFSQGDHRFYTEYNGTPGTEKFTILSNGNVGIGTTNPNYGLLHLNSETFGDNILLALSTKDGINNPRVLLKHNTSATRQYLEFTSTFSTGVGRADFIFSYGNVGIGTTAPPYKLSVEGTIGAREVIVTSDAWADFVFEPTYKLMPLIELDTYIQENKHLPEIPTTAEVQENGISVGEMNAKLLQKIEELTLYVIELKKENDQLNEKVDALIQE